MTSPRNGLLVFLVMSLSFSCLASGTLVNLDLTFEDNSWQAVLVPNVDKPECSIVKRDDGKCLKVSRGMMTTAKMPYSRGTIHVSFDAKTTDITPGQRPYHVAWASVHLYNQEGKNIGHKDVMNVSRKSDWTHYKLDVKGVRADTCAFKLTIGNAGTSGTVWIDNLKINIDTSGKPLCGDPGFVGSFAVDHWNNPREGVDWDKLVLKGEKGLAEYVDGTFPGPGKSLHLKGNATFRSNRYPYDGSAMLFGGWIKHRDRTKGIKPWAWANVQLVIFDEQDQVLGHSDLTPLGVADGEWTYYSRYIPESKFRRNTAYVELWLRGFEGSTGDSWFDEIQLIKFPSSTANRRKYDADKATVTIDAGKPAGETIRPVWNGTDISYASKIRVEVVKELLAEMRRNGVTHLRTREFLQGLGIYQSATADGEPILDWKLLDEVLDWAVLEQKFILTATIETTPNQIATEKKKGRPHCNRSVPDDFELWGKIVRKLLQHWVDRYGVEVVSKWTFECWNEPCAQHYYKGTRSEFLQIVDQYMKATAAVGKQNNCQLRTGSISGVNNSPFFKMVFDHLQKQGELSRINPVSMHIYSGFVNSFDSFPDSIKRMQKSMKSYDGLKDAQMIITEYNGSSMNHAGRDSHVVAAFNVKANRVFLDTGVKRGYFFSPVDYMYSNKQTYFNGGSGMFTKNGIPKPVFNTAVLLNKLYGGKRLPFSSSNEPLDGIAVADGRTVKVLLTSFDETKMAKEVTTDVQLNINWPEMPRNLTCTMYRIDRTHANSYSKWLELGKPKMSKATDAVLRKANQLKETEFTAFSRTPRGIQTKLKVPTNSVILLTFRPAQ